MKNDIGKILLRMLLVSLYAILVMRLVGFAMPDNVEFQSDVPKKIFFFFYLLFFNFNVEGSLFFDRYLNKVLPWFNAPKKRILIQSAFVILWTLITLGLPFVRWYFINEQSLIYPPASIIIFIGSIVFLFSFIGISMSINFFTQWQNSSLNAEYYKQEKLKADYRVLQNQLNPHFLFNSLNVLISEIKHNPTTAVEFTRKLSKVYRYVLQSKSHDLIALKNELEFIQSFIYLHKIRIGDNLECTVDVSEEMLHLQLPPLTLQILFENAIKHNIANEENVLKISVTSGENDTLIISNNLQSIDTAESTNTGLSNLGKRFELLKKGGFIYKEQDGNFIVTIPLINE